MPYRKRKKKNNAEGKRADTGHEPADRLYGEAIRTLGAG